MSRIIVKGLPVYLEEPELKTHFAKRLITTHSTSQVDGLITDLKILKNRDGKSRRFAFIGYKDEQDAFDAVNYFDGSFINTSKIEVSMAKSFADPRVPVSMKEKRREALKRLREKEEMLLAEKNKKLKVEDKNKKVNINAEIEKDQQLKEFIETMKPTAQTSSWEKVSGGTVKAGESTYNNPLLDDQENSQTSVNPLLAQALSMKKDGEESDDEYMDFGAKDEPQQKEEEQEEERMIPLSEIKEDLDAESKEDDGLAKNEEISDLDWIKQRRVRIKENGDKVSEKPTEPETNEEEQTEEKETYEEPQQDNEEIALEKIRKTGRLFLRNILYTSSEEDFKKLFSTYGKLKEVHIATDTRTGTSKGFAYVLFSNPEEAVQAYIELDKQIFQGRLLHILPADEMKDHRLDEFDLKNMPLKKQRELKRKATAAKSTFSWNSLFMNQDAVLGSVAAKLGVQKSDLIDPENSNSAVKQALAEAHVIGDVRKYFEGKGVDLTKFSQLKSPAQRDDRVILVKNFPFGTTREELGDLFLPFGKLERLLMPPAGTIAIVQFRDTVSARSAFTKLAFKRFKGTIIYLEKGPKECFTKEATAEDKLELDEERNAVEAGISSTELLDSSTNKDTNTAEEAEDDGISGPTVSIFIKNLNFKTTSQQLADRFKVFNGFVVAQVKTKPDPKQKGKTLSMGFGFAEFKTKEQANAVITAMDGSVIDGHKIQLKLSHRQGNTNTSTGKKRAKNGKIIVKNLPFEATRKDVFELFSSFGQLKSVRVPKKFDKSARGFAFVEFLLPKEAETAMDQLQGVHLLGRRLVMQPAEQEAANAEEELERMTKKVRKQAAVSEIASMTRNPGKRKLDMEGDEEDGF
ncbi:Multiple RNA-binding domain-containing protein 1 [Nakaseomyces bracarensis]|uniref:Multiple RNA-binding domain-containing protein 1 n=1 Tax=Nakaseomyces bracarensis TaxID=273131 RepID=A0ABR4NY69_9SACH